MAQRGCPRLITAQSRSGAESTPLEPPEGVPLPTITFGDRMQYRDARETVHLVHTPGHSEDSLVVYAHKAGVLFAGDTVEWPLPNFAQRDAKEEWVRTLRQLKQLPAELVVPSHGEPTGKTIIDANERYVSGVYEAVAAAKRAGAGRSELELPAEQFLDAGTAVDEIYADVHRANLVWAWDES